MRQDYLSLADPIWPQEGGLTGRLRAYQSYDLRKPQGVRRKKLNTKNAPIATIIVKYALGIGTETKDSSVNSTDELDKSKRPNIWPSKKAKLYCQPTLEKKLEAPPQNGTPSSALSTMT